MEQRGAVHMEPSSDEEELTPARNSRPEKTYHCELTRAPVARGGGGAQGKTELALANWSGRNDQLQQWHVVELACCGCCLRWRKRERSGGASAAPGCGWPSLEGSAGTVGTGRPVVPRGELAGEWPHAACAL